MPSKPPAPPKQRRPLARKEKCNGPSPVFTIAVFGGAALAGGYRFGMETTKEVKIIAIEQTADGSSRIITDGGSYKNENSLLGGKFKSNFKTVDVQSQLKVGGTYMVHAYGGIIDDANILDVTMTKQPAIGGTETTPQPGTPRTTDLPPSVAPTAALPKLAIVMPTGTAPAPYTGARRIDEGKGPGYALSAAEIKFVTSIFGPGIDFKTLRLHFFKTEQGKTAGMTRAFLSGYGSEEYSEVSPITVDFYGAKYVSREFTEDNIFNFGCFIHEMTHVWQGQTLNKSFSKSASTGYPYTLTPGARFVDYGPEQQAGIVEDYARRFLYPEGKGFTTPSNYKNTKAAYDEAARNYRPDKPGVYVVPKNLGQDSPETDALLRDVVENMFPEAKKTRLKVEAGQNIFAAIKNKTSKNYTV